MRFGNGRRTIEVMPDLRTTRNGKDIDRIFARVRAAIAGSQRAN